MAVGFFLLEVLQNGLVIDIQNVFMGKEYHEISVNDPNKFVDVCSV